MEKIEMTENSEIIEKIEIVEKPELKLDMCELDQLVKIIEKHNEDNESEESEVDHKHFYDEWISSYSDHAGHLKLTGVLRDYYDHIDNLVMNVEIDSKFYNNDVANAMKIYFNKRLIEMEEQFQNDLKTFGLERLYNLRNDKNEYIANMKNIHSVMKCPKCKECDLKFDGNGYDMKTGVKDNFYSCHNCKFYSELRKM